MNDLGPAKVKTESSQEQLDLLQRIFGHPQMTVEEYNHQMQVDENECFVNALRQFNCLSRESQENFFNRWQVMVQADEEWEREKAEREKEG